MNISLDLRHLKRFVERKDLDALAPAVTKAHQDLENRTGLGHEFTGWLDLPQKTSDAFLKELEKLGEEIRGHSDCLVSIGIGGSYIGIRASLEFLISDQKLPVY